MKNKEGLSPLGGFTIVEMLVIAGIFVIVAGMVLVNFKKGENSTQFLLATEEVASNIRKTQTQTLTGSIEQEIVASGGFGLYFNLGQPDQYLTFRDNGDQLYQSGNDAVMASTTLPANITISALSNNPLTIVFKPPKPTIYLNGGLLDNSGDIYLTSQQINDKRGHININRITGRITAELEQL